MRPPLRSRLASTLPALLAALLVFAALSPALLHGAGRLLSARYDWRYFETMVEVARRSVVWYGQAPLWNPYSCGGEVDLANPQALVGAPTFLFTLLFGTAWGLKLSLFTYYWLALGGMYCLARRLGLDALPAAIAAVCFGLSGYFATHLGAGHINFATVGLFPLLIYCFDRALATFEWALPAAAVAAWIALYGGTFTPVLAGEILFLWATAAALSPWPGAALAGLPLRRRLLRAYGLLALIPVGALLLGAYRMVPALEFMLDHPRPLFRRRPDFTPLSRLAFDLFAWRTLGPLPGRIYWSHEYTARMPQVAAPLLVLALLSTRLRPLALRLLPLTALGALLTMGNFSPYAPWSLLQKLPIARDLRVPSRHLILVVFFLALLAGVGADGLTAWLRRIAPRPARLLAPALLLLAFVGASVDSVLFTNLHFRDNFQALMVPPAAPPPFFYVAGHWSQMRELVFGGNGVLNCDEEAPLQRAKSLDVGDVPQVRLADPQAGAILSSQFSPNRRRIRIGLQRSDTLLLLNSNWNEHFHLRGPAAQAGAQIIHPDGQLAVDLRALPPGLHDIDVVYAPRSFSVGVALSLITLPLAVLWFVRRANRRRRAATPAGATSGSSS